MYKGGSREPPLCTLAESPFLLIDEVYIRRHGSDAAQRGLWQFRPPVYSSATRSPKTERAGRWTDVTLNHAADIATGNYPLLWLLCATKKIQGVLRIVRSYEYKEVVFTRTPRHPPLLVSAWPRRSLLFPSCSDMAALSTVVLQRQGQPKTYDVAPVHSTMDRDITVMQRGARVSIMQALSYFRQAPPFAQTG